MCHFIIPLFCFINEQSFPFYWALLYIEPCLKYICKKYTPDIKEIWLEWVPFDRAKIILGLLPVSWAYSMSLGDSDFYRDAICFCWIFHLSFHLRKLMGVNARTEPILLIPLYHTKSFLVTQKHWRNGIGMARRYWKISAEYRVKQYLWCQQVKPTDRSYCLNLEGWGEYFCLKFEKLFLSSQ